MLEQAEEKNEFVDVAGLVERGVAVSASTIYKWVDVAPKGFPRPMRLGRRLVWRVSEIETWIEARRVPPKAKSAVTG